MLEESVIDSSHTKLTQKARMGVLGLSVTERAQGGPQLGLPLECLGGQAVKMAANASGVKPVR